MGAPQGEPLELGVVTKPHGVRGELKVQLYWAESTVLEQIEQVFLEVPEQPRRSFKVQGVRRANKVALVKLDGVDDRDAAEALRGARLFAARSEMPPLESDEYYLIDLVGFEVRSPDKSLGRIVDVRAHATVDTLVVEDAAGVRREQPLVDSWVEEVRFEDRVVLLSSEDGLID